jgi:hypothetical protein
VFLQNMTSHKITPPAGQAFAGVWFELQASLFRDRKDFARRRGFVFITEETLTES